MRHLRGAAILSLLFLNLALHGIPIFLLGLIKLLLPGQGARTALVRFGVAIAERWVGMNNRIIDTFLSTRFQTDAGRISDREGHSLIISNHRSWVDILVVQRIFHERTAFPRFFAKQAVLWLPILGQACWALDFPFMKRYSAEYLERHPEKRGTDLATTRRACQRYRRLPVSILNFVEGTRFSEEKRERQESPYRYLLIPRIGGVAFVLASMGDQLQAVYDVTIAYPGMPAVSFWDFLTNRVPEIKALVRRREVPSKFVTATITEPGPMRSEFKQWIESMWREKDDLLATLGASE